MAFPVWRKKPAAESTTPPAGGVARRPNKAFTPHPAIGAQCLMQR
ncbi:hypothetical protein OIU82_16955 [Escherichia coli]|nr:hypothetical protein [Escherichia coli]